MCAILIGLAVLLPIRITWTKGYSDVEKENDLTASRSA
jgi:hypothetical protein